MFARYGFPHRLPDLADLAQLWGMSRIAGDARHPPFSAQLQALRASFAVYLQEAGVLCCAVLHLGPVEQNLGLKNTLLGLSRVQTRGIDSSFPS